MNNILWPHKNKQIKRDPLVEPEVRIQLPSIKDGKSELFVPLEILIRPQRLDSERDLLIVYCRDRKKKLLQPKL